jgi:hypothetical protein
LLVYDYDVLAGLFANEPELAVEFKNLVDEAFTIRGEAFAIRGETYPTCEIVKAEEQLEKLKDTSEYSWSKPLFPKAKANELKEELGRIEHGKDGSKSFEKWCESCLRYAFPLPK